MSAESDVVVVQGDIADEVADSIISPDDKMLTMSGGASAALREAGGSKLYQAAQAKTPLDSGQAVVTPGYDLFAEYVIHAVGSSSGGRATTESVSEAAASAFDAADEHGCRSVVVPPLGSGIGGLDSTQSAELICQAASEGQFDSLNDIRIVTRSSDDYRKLFEVVTKHRQRDTSNA